MGKSTVSIKTGLIAGHCTIFVGKGTLTIILTDGLHLEKTIDELDFYDTFQQIQAELSTLNFGLKVCGNCQYFGFSSMAHQASGGERGYCTVINGLKVGARKGDVVGVIDTCDFFRFRKGITDCSPWLPA